MRDKIKSFVIQLESKNQTKLAAKLKKTLSTVEEFVKTIGVPKNDPKVLKIKEIKSKPQLYGKDKAMIKLLWMQVKRESLHKKMKEYNITRSVVEEKSDFLDQVLDHLDKEVTKAIVDFKGYPQEKEASDKKIAATLGAAYNMSRHLNFAGPDLKQKFASNLPPLTNEFFDLWAELGKYDGNDSLPLDLKYLESQTSKLEKLRDIQKPVFERVMNHIAHYREVINLAKSFLTNLESNNTAELEKDLNRSSLSATVYFKLKQFIDEKTLEHLYKIKNSPEMTLWLTCKESKCRSLAEKVAQE